jgi:hypothetical protein
MQPLKTYRMEQYLKFLNFKSKLSCSYFDLGFSARVDNVMPWKSVDLDGPKLDCLKFSTVLELK